MSAPRKASDGDAPIRPPPNLKMRVVGWLLYLVADLLRRTYRIQVIGREHRSEAERVGRGHSFCLALWHEHLFASIVAHAGQRFAPLASLSSDGDLVTFVMNRLGFRAVRGSSSRGGEAARDGMVSIMQEGWFTAVTVDGPRGPRRRVKGGVVDVGRRALVPVVPLVTKGAREWVLAKSWDQFKIPKPFSRVVVAYGAPINVPAETQGLAFGDAKRLIRVGLEATERAACDALGLARPTDGISGRNQPAAATAEAPP